MNLVIKIALGIVLAVVILVAGCSALVGVSVANDPQAKKAFSDLDDMSGANDAKYREAMRYVYVGMHRYELMAVMYGLRPRDRQVMQTAGTKTEYLYWGSWQITLTNGVVDGKSKF
jgi:hypothetical protein